MTVQFTVLLDDDTNAAAVKVTGLKGQSETAVLRPGTVTVDNPNAFESLVFSSLTPGNWSIRLDSPFESGRIILPKLPADGPLGWWHYAMGIRESNIARGSGMTVGVIDRGLELSVKPCGISHVISLGYSERRDPRAEVFDAIPFHHHSNSIASILFSKADTPYSYEGIVPGATAYFYGTRLPEHLPAKQYGLGLDPAQVANAIRELATERDCDIISISAGDVMHETDEILIAIEDARDAGTLCFFASGNTGGELFYPACYDEALAVAALGLRGFAPQETNEYYHDTQSQRSATAELYLWDSSCTGLGLTFVAPGSNVLWDHHGKPGNAVNGTSWAAPCAAGMAAVILSETKERWARLSRSRERWHEMFTIMTEHCQQLDLPQADVGYGLLKR